MLGLSRKAGIVLLSSLLLLGTVGLAVGQQHSKTNELTDGREILDSRTTYQVHWNRTYGGEVLTDVVALPGGGAVAVGTTGHDDDSGWLVSLGPGGDIRWSRTYATGAVTSDRLEKMIPADDGGYLLAGEAQTGTLNSQGWLVRVNATGGTIWSEMYGRSSKHNTVNAVIETADGGYLFVGRATPENKDWGDAWVVKVGSDGDVQWRRTFGGPDSDGASAVRQTENGHYFVAGKTESYRGEQAGSDIWLLKLDSDGSLVWNRTYGSGEGESLCLGSRPGTVVLGGSGEGENDRYGAILMGLTRNGSVDWREMYPHLGDVTTLVRAPESGYAFVGSYSIQNSGFVRVAANRTIIVNKTFGRSGGVDALVSLSRRSGGGYVLSGMTESFGTHRIDGWVIQLGTTAHDQRAGESPQSTTESAVGAGGETPTMGTTRTQSTTVSSPGLGLLTSIVALVGSGLLLLFPRRV